MKYDTRTPIGIAGLGLMGHAFAERLQIAGFPLSVYNRSAKKTEDFVRRGATAVSTPRELADRSSVVIVMVSDDQALYDVVTSESGLLQSEKASGTVVINMSTVSPEATDRVHEECASRGVRFVDCPVSGSTPQAKSGELILLASGSMEVIEDLAPILGILGKKTIYAGDVGKGTRLKLSVNLVLAHLAAALADGVDFCRHVDLDPKLLLEVLANAPALNAGYFQGKGMKTIERDYSPQFPLKHMLKDVRLAQSCGVSQRVLDSIERVMSDAVGEGYADKDISAMIEGIS